MKQLIVIFIGIICTSQALAQSAWNKKKGTGFFKLSETVIVADNFYDRIGDIVPIKTAGVYITSLYGEYGLSNKLTVFGYFPFFFRNTINAQEQTNSGITEAGDESNSIGDTYIGLSLSLLQKGPLALNTSLTLGLPVGKTSGGRDNILQSGDGEFNQLLKLNAGFSFYPKPAYATASIGFNNRTNNFSDELHISAEVGVTFFERLSAALKIYSLNSLENGSEEPSQTGVFSNDLEYFAIGPELNYALKSQWGLSLGFQGAASGRSILASPSYSFGIFYNL